MKNKFFKKLVVSATCVLVLATACFGFAGCGSDDSAAGIDVWKQDATRGTATYNNQHKYFAKFTDTEGAVYVYSTDSEDSTRITAFAAFNCTFTEADGEVTIEPINGYIHAMNGDNPINMDFEGDGATTWWNNTVGESMTLVLADDGTFEVKAAE